MSVLRGVIEFVRLLMAFVDFARQQKRFDSANK